MITNIDEKLIAYIPVSKFNSYVINTNTLLYDGITYNFADIGLSTNYKLTASSTSISIEWFGYFLAKSNGIHTFYITSSSSTTYMWIGYYALTNYTQSTSILANVSTNKTCTYDMVSGTYYPIRIQYSSLSGGSFNFSFISPSTTQLYNFDTYLYYDITESLFEFRMPSINTNPWYYDSVTDSINISNIGTKMTLSFEKRSDLYTDNDGPYLAIKDERTQKYVRHAGLYLKLSTFTPNNFDFAWKFELNGPNGNVTFYNAYSKPHFLTYNTTTAKMWIQQTNIVPIVLTEVKSSPLYTDIYPSAPTLGGPNNIGLASNGLVTIYDTTPKTYPLSNYYNGTGLIYSFTTTSTYNNISITNMPIIPNPILTISNVKTPPF